MRLVSSGREFRRGRASVTKAGFDWCMCLLIVVSPWSAKHSHHTHTTRSDVGQFQDAYTIHQPVLGYTFMHE